MTPRLALACSLLLLPALACSDGPEPAEVTITKPTAGAGGQAGGAQGGSAGSSAGQPGGGQGGASGSGQAGSAGSAGSPAGSAGQSGQGGGAGSGGSAGSDAGSGGSAGSSAGQAGGGAGGSAGLGGGSGAGGAGGSAGQGGGAAGAGAAGAAGSGFPPSTGNVGWVGGACETDDDCKIEGGFCIKNGFPNGYCSAPCSQFCPDRSEPGDTATFCADGSTVGQGEGACLSRCDVEVFPGTGCAPGYACVDRNRYAEPAVVETVCLPQKAPGACAKGDDLLIPIDYPDKGAVWIPAEARCGGSFDLVVMLHGINPDSHTNPSLGGDGRRLEVLARGLIDGGLLRPLVLAEPVHFQGSSTLLYGSEFDLLKHLSLVKAQLEPLGITVASLSYTGHSGAGCDESNGLYKVLKQYGSLIPSQAPSMLLWGLEDICYESSYHWEAPLAVLPATGAALINMYSVQGDPDAFEAGILPDAEAMPCNDTLYSSCLRSPTRPWCSYRTRSQAGIGHDNNPYFFVREVFPQVFSPTQSKSPCHAQ